jgi:hypothetical protein
MIHAGVPIVTRAGDIWRNRIGAAILYRAGLPVSQSSSLCLPPPASGVWSVAWCCYPSSKHQCRHPTVPLLQSGDRVAKVTVCSDSLTRSIYFPTGIMRMRWGLNTSTIPFMLEFDVKLLCHLRGVLRGVLLGVACVVRCMFCVRCSASLWYWSLLLCLACCVLCLC